VWGCGGSNASDRRCAISHRSQKERASIFLRSTWSRHLLFEIRSSPQHLCIACTRAFQAGSASRHRVQTTRIMEVSVTPISHALAQTLGVRSTHLGLKASNQEAQSRCDRSIEKR